MTGPVAIDHAELAAALGTALERVIRYAPVSDDEFVTLMIQLGFGDEYARFLADALSDIADAPAQRPRRRHGPASLRPPRL